jgi:predicted short-subunit dehydrogenase-like oxidoreductase (DUF2520 family)
MLPAMAAKTRIAIVGAGRLGTALAVQLHGASYKITQLISRDRPRSEVRSLARRLRAQVSSFDNLKLDADLIWVCVPDREISAAARKLANAAVWTGKVAFHSSGVLPGDELNALRQRGAVVASVHPLMTFVRSAIPSLKGVPFALEGDVKALRVARKIVRGLGAEPFEIPAKHKPAYHAWGAFTSPLLIALLVTAEQVAKAAGVSAADARKKMLPILRQTIENYSRLGPAGAFSGPLVRGDVAVVRKHLQVLRKFPEARDVYVTLAKSALRHLPVHRRARIEETLQRKSRD